MLIVPIRASGGGLALTGLGTRGVWACMLDAYESDKFSARTGGI